MNEEKEESCDFDFQTATPETLEKELALAVLVFGEKTAQFHDYRRALLERNPEMTHYLFDRGNLVASINMVSLSGEGIARFKEGERGWLLGDYTMQFEPGRPQECVIIDLLTTPLVPANRRTLYASQLLFHMSSLLTEWGGKGYAITRVYANGGTLEGRHLLETAGFRQIAERGSRLIYELDMEHADLRMLAPYRAALTEWRKEHQGEE